MYKKTDAVNYIISIILFLVLSILALKYSLFYYIILGYLLFEIFLFSFLCLLIQFFKPFKDEVRKMLMPPFYSFSCFCLSKIGIFSFFGFFIFLYCH